MGWWDTWGPVVSGVAGAASSYSTAEDQRRFSEQAGQPQPFERNDSPYGPVQPFLAELPGMASDLYQQMSNRPSPSWSGPQGPSPQMQEISDAIRGQAMNSQFMPQMQNQMMDFSSGPSDMVQGVYDRAMNYQNPHLEALMGRGMNGGFMGQTSPMMGSFLQALLGGGESLGPDFLPQMMGAMGGGGGGMGGGRGGFMQALMGGGGGAPAGGMGVPTGRPSLPFPGGGPSYGGDVVLPGGGGPQLQAPPPSPISGRLAAIGGR